jgi:excinuclease ABC subunit A
MTKTTSVRDLSPEQYILIAGARLNNLKNIDVAIPRGTFTVITGLSGSGKSTLAFDTLYAEGQRRYVESLSSYARQFLARLEKPEVDYIKGISPAIAIEQKVITRNPRSTVGTSTEIYELLKLLFARIGKVIHPKTGEEVKIDETDDVVKFLAKNEDKRGILYIPNNLLSEFTPEALIAQGFSRGRQNEKFLPLEDIQETEPFDLVIDRFSVNATDEDWLSSIGDSIELAFNISEGYCLVDIYEGNEVSEKKQFSKDLIKDGIEFMTPDLQLFNFNSPIGACPECEGFGQILGISEDLVIPDKSLSLYDYCVAPWKGSKMGQWRRQVINNAHHVDFPVHTAYKDLSAEQKDFLWNGSSHFKGINDFFDHLRQKLYKIQNRVLISRYKGRTDCHVCKGSRLRKEALYVQVAGKNIGQINRMTIRDAYGFFKSIELDSEDLKIADRIIKETLQRLTFLKNVGVEYIALDRLSNSLSGGESQRINLATSLGSSLVGATYILDEPSIGLHPLDTQHLIGVIKSLNENGNTVLVVEHDEEIIRSAAYIIDIGPKAGRNGGEVVYQGSAKKMLGTDTITADYLNGKRKVTRPAFNYNPKHFIHLEKCYKHNLKVDSIKFPLYGLTVVCGVSGSGKSTLILEELVPALRKHIDQGGKEQVSGDLSHIQDIVYVDQNPIGKSSRSNPVTYVKAFDEIRTLFSKQALSKMRGYKPGHFSLNVPGGRCEKCQGEGEITVEMQFMADIKVKCEECNGKKYKKDVLEVLYQDKSINDILEMTIDEAIELFQKKAKDDGKKKTTEQKILDKMLPLQKVGLGYVQVGQSSSTLSGGEAQRVKLAYFLIKGNVGGNTLFIFDEPTTGLHFEDINLLLVAFNELLEKEHHVLVIEHNLDVIRAADHIIEIGPGGGDAGGKITFEGSSAQLKKSKTAVTGRYL